MVDVADYIGPCDFEFKVIDGTHISFNLEDEIFLGIVENDPDFFIRELTHLCRIKDEFKISYDLNQSYKKSKLPFTLPQMTLDELDKIIYWCERYLDFYYSNTVLVDYANLVIANKKKYRAKLLKRINRDNKKVYTQRRRADFSKQRDKLMLLVIDRDGYFCQACKTTKGLQVDHIHPLSKGGSDDLDNLQLLCQSCNASKGDRV